MDYISVHIRFDLERYLLIIDNESERNQNDSIYNFTDNTSYFIEGDFVNCVNNFVRGVYFDKIHTFTE